ncbi:MAG TPA: DUF4476 domain-containing protein [Verrucomicrobiae bacterium]
MKRLWYAVAVIGVCGWQGWAADRPEAQETPFEESLQSLKAERDNGEKLRRAGEMVRARRLSSMQVKAIAAGLSDDNARLEFATAAYPRTVDRENFYEVYDAFTTFSRVMRLHDRIQQFERATGPQVEIPPTVTNQELTDIIRSLRRESFDQTRSRLAQQIIRDSRKLFLASQVKKIVDCFDFEPSKLEVAKQAYDRTLDREKYFLVTEAFSFDSSKQELSRYIQSRNERPGPVRGP